MVIMSLWDAATGHKCETAAKHPDHDHVTAAMLGLPKLQGPFITTIHSALS